MAHSFAPLRLARDTDLRSYALGDLKCAEYTGIRMQRNTAGILNLCRHLRQTKLPSTSAWKDKSKTLLDLKYHDVFVDVQDLLDPSALVCNYQLPKRNTWRQVISVLVALHHSTSRDPDQETEMLPYQRAAMTAVAEAKEDADSRTVKRLEEQLKVFDDNWSLIPKTTYKLLELIEYAMMSSAPDMEEFEDILDQLPLPPGCLPRDEIEARERRLKIEEEAANDDFELMQPCGSRSDAKKQLTEAIWGVRNLCPKCNGSGFSNPSEMCGRCSGKGHL